MRIRPGAPTRKGIRPAGWRPADTRRLALQKLSLLLTQHQPLTAPPKRAQHTEKTAVFDYSKVKERLSLPGTECGSRPNGMSRWKHNEPPFLAARPRWTRPVQLVPGATINGKNRMQSTHVQPSTRLGSLWGLCASAILVVALLISAPFVHSGWAQGTVPPTATPAQTSTPPAAAPC